MSEIIHKTIYVDNNKRIDVFDGVLPLQIRTNLYQIATSASFKIGWSDTTEPEKKSNDFFLHSKFGFREVEGFGIFQYFKDSDIWPLIKKYNLVQCVLNLSTTSDVNHIHTHSEKLVVLYYVNLDWRDGFHGETQFYSEDKKSVTFTSPYTPGRIIVFDASIPHTIRPQSIIGPQYRFSLALIYD